MIWFDACVRANSDAVTVDSLVGESLGPLVRLHIVEEFRLIAPNLLNDGPQALSDGGGTVFQESLNVGPLEKFMKLCGKHPVGLKAVGLLCGGLLFIEANLLHAEAGGAMITTAEGDQFAAVSTKSTQSGRRRVVGVPVPFH